MAAYESDTVGVEVGGGRFWPLFVVLGVLTTAVGVWLILSPNAAVFTLALLLAIGLFLNGLSALVFAGGHSSPGVGYFMGVLYIVGGIVVLVWPDITLKALAVFLGIVLMIVGLVQLALALLDREDVEHWVWLAVLGAITFLAGVIAVFWPEATVMVLAILLGIRLTVFGLTEIYVGWTLRKLSH